MSFGDDEIVDVEAVIVFGVGDRTLERLADVARDALARELQIGERRLHLLAADELSEKIELLRADAQHAGDRLGFVVLQGALGLRFRHDGQALFAFLSAACPWKVRVGENSPNLWPIISSVTLTGICLWPL